MVAGVGNIYADEALFMAGIHPLRPASSLTGDEIARLQDAIRAVLQESIDERGTLLRDYRTPYGQDGAYQNRLRVYQQTGQPCPALRHTHRAHPRDPTRDTFLPPVPVVAGLIPTALRSMFFRKRRLHHIACMQEPV